MRVKIYETETRTGGGQKVIGELMLKDGKIVASTRDVTDLIRPIVIGGKDEKEPYIRIDPLTEPERFLRNLCREYNGSYLRASELIE